MDLLGPFPQAPGQLKYHTVVVAYATKWIEAEPLSSISSARIQSHVFKQLICRFGIPAPVITDNGTQFIGKNFKAVLDGLHIRQHFSSVEHPQTNGQEEAANKILLLG